MQLWFETHSTSVDNERGVASGHLDSPLSMVGRDQAAELGRRYPGGRLQTVYSSDLMRAYSTAEIAFGDAVRLVKDRRLRECDYGQWSGCSVRKLHDSKLSFVEEPFPGGESFREVVNRVDSLLEEIARDEGPVLIIGHRAPWYALEHLLKRRELVEVVAAQWNWQPGWEYVLYR